MGILDAPSGQSKPQARIASLYNRLASASANPFGSTTAAADTPTVSFGTAATLTGIVYGPQSGLVTEVGSRGNWNTTFGRLDISGKGSSAGLDFTLTGSSVEVEFASVGTGALPLWIWVNGVPTTVTQDTTTVTGLATGTQYFLKLVFPSSGRRRVEIFAGGGAAVGSWRTIRTDLLTLITPSPRRPVVAFVGDSLFDGASGAATNLQTCAFTMARLLGVECVNVSFGGTGYSATGAFQTFGSATRQATLSLANPELIIASGSVNDDTFSATVGAAASAAYTAWGSILPKTKIIVFGPQPSGATNTISANRAAVNAAVKAAALAAPNVLAYHDMIGSANGLPAAWSSVTTYNTGDLVTRIGSVWMASNGAASFNGAGSTPGTSNRWVLQTYAYTGTGTVAVPTGDGTRDLYLYNDAVHPMPEGAYALALRQANIVRDDLRAIALA